ncbi:MAG: hypothetical protein AB1894_01185 [Chloroflexota bacterium]
MTTRRMKIATLDEAGLEKLRQMEAAMGTLILALEPHYPMAALSDEQIEKLQALEQELGVVLIAYQT